MEVIYGLPTHSQQGERNGATILTSTASLSFTGAREIQGCIRNQTSLSMTHALSKYDTYLE